MMRRGFTLIEALIYLALFAIVIGGLAEAAYGLFESSERDQTRAMMQEEENFLIGKINRAFNNATSVGQPGANASGPTLSTIGYDGSTNTIRLSGTNMFLNGAILNNSNVSITNLAFIHTYQGGTQPESVEAGFTISARTPSGAVLTESASTTDYIQK